MTSIGDVVQSMQNGIYKAPHFYSSDGTACLRMYNIENGKIVWKDIKRIDLTESEREQYALSEGDILVNRVNSRELVGKAAYIPEDLEFCIYESKNIRLRFSRDCIDSRLVSFWFYITAQQYFNENAQQTVGMASINQVQIGLMPFPLPPLNEQRRIADRLDHLLIRIDKTKAHLDRIPPLLKRFRQSVLAAATSGKLTEDWRLNQIGKAHDTYSLLELKSLVDESMRNGKSVRDGDGIPVLRLSALKHGRLDWSYIKNGDWEGIDVNRFLVKENDFLISRGNGSKDLVGRGALVLNVVSAIAFPDTMIRIRPNTSKILSRYLQLIWDTQAIRDQVESSAKTSAGIWKISQSDLEIITIPTPSLPEQTEIVRRVETLFAKADRIETQYKKARQEVDRLTPALLAKAFRGELIPQDPTDEPASVLLERINREKGREKKGKGRSKKT